MELKSATSASAGGTFDPQYERIVVVFNASPTEQTLALPARGSAGLALHPLLQVIADVRLQKCSATPAGLYVPARTTAVFVTPRA